jgi:indolepyruvate ferredoxin oxidoreductase
VVYDPKEAIDLAAFPRDVNAARARRAAPVQRDLAEVEGVSAIVYVQTCAAEKRRRRKRGTFPDPDTRVFINTDVCEGCGDCGVQSNCVAIVPVETALGRKRAIDQSACNKDFSCLKGFCPSFVTLEGATPKKPAVEVDMSRPAGARSARHRGTHNMVITGIGGTGVVTIGAVLARPRRSRARARA